MLEFPSICMYNNLRWIKSEVNYKEVFVAINVISEIDSLDTLMQVRSLRSLGKMSATSFICDCFALAYQNFYGKLSNYKEI